jgi:hypothetical protein
MMMKKNDGFCLGTPFPVPWAGVGWSFATKTKGKDNENEMSTKQITQNTKH